jgi:hypothetical protein
MFRRVISRVVIVACPGLLIAGCETPTHPTAVTDAIRSPHAASSDPGGPEVVTSQRSATLDRNQPVLRFSDLSQAGTSQLVRTPNGVNFTLSTTGLTAGHAYTLWIVIFNNPDGCTDGTPGFSNCGPMDVVNAAARPDMMYAAGNIAGGAGRGTFAGRRHLGDLTGSANAPVLLPAFGLENPGGAEIHLVVHDHGLKIPAFLPDMIQTIDGGCFDAGVPEAGASSPWNDYAGAPGAGAFGRRGPNACASVQFAVHRP